MRNAAKYRWRQGECEVTRSICWSPPGCHGGCGVRLSTRAGRLVKVEGDPDNRYNRGWTCIRCSNVIEAISHPQRLTQPLLRAGARGENRWKRISFSEAIQIVADNFLTIKEKNGAESVIFCKGTARDIGGWLPRLCYGFGSPNYFGFGPGNGNACYRPRVAVSTAMLGGLPVPDLGQFDDSLASHQPPQCLLIWGANPIISNPDGLFGGWVRDLIFQGVLAIVVDPQETWLATKARHWLRLKPGTDGALALGMIHVLLQENLIDREFCAKWVLGTNDVKDVALNYSPERVASITGVSPESIRAAARDWAMAKLGSLIWGVGVDMNAGCLGTIQGLAALMALTGNVENPGGMILQGDPFGVNRRGDDVADFPQVKLKRIGAERYPLIEIGNPYAQPDVLLDQLESGDPYPIKAAWLQGVGIVPSGFADPERVIRLFKRLEFTVMVDVFMNPAAVAFADVVLPAAMFPEKDSLYVHYAQLGAINKVVEPPMECRSDADIILAAGKRIAPEHFPWPNVEDWMDERLKPAGLAFKELRDIESLTPPVHYGKHESGQLRKDGAKGFATPSGKIELRSSILDKCHLYPLPSFRDYSQEYRSGSDSGDYPFILTTGARQPYFFCSEHRQIESLRRLQPQPLVLIHPDDAVLRDIRNGDPIKISSPFGSCRMRAQISRRFSAGVVHCDYGWWFPEENGAEPNLFGIRSSNVNALLPSGLQGPGGFGYPFRSFICSVEKIES